MIDVPKFVHELWNNVRRETIADCFTKIEIFTGISSLEVKEDVDYKDAVPN